MPSNWRVHAKHVTPISPGHSGLASIPLGLRCGSSRNPGKTSEIACGILANSEAETAPREISVSGGSPPARTRFGEHWITPLTMSNLKTRPELDLERHLSTLGHALLACRLAARLTGDKPHF